MTNADEFDRTVRALLRKIDEAEAKRKATPSTVEPEALGQTKPGDSK